jgi:fumarate reductase subunit D
MKGKTIEPFLWTLFSAGGVVAALALPIYLFLFGVAYPLGWLTSPSQEQMHNLIGNWLTRGVLLVICTLPLFHAAHRFRYTLYDGLQVKHLNDVINPLCYGAAVVGSVLAVWLVLSFS